MSKFLLIPVLTLLVGLLSLSSVEGVSAQDCERVIEGNTQSPCKQLDYLDGIQPPTFTVERFEDSYGKYGCQGRLSFSSASPLSEHVAITIAGGRSYSTQISDDSGSYRYWNLRETNWAGSIISQYYAAGHRSQWTSPDVYRTEVETNRVFVGVGPETHLSNPVKDIPYVPPFLLVAAKFGIDRNGDPEYTVVSSTFDKPDEVADYKLLMNQCLAGITRQLEHDSAVEEARKQAEQDKIRAETAAEEAQNQAELAAIELQSAEAALIAAEELNTALLQETILSIKREDAIRAAWQQVILVRMAGLEARTAIWNEAVTRWAEEDLQFSSSMEARIQEVERLQALNAALEQSMTDQRRILIARLEELEKAEQEVLATREPTN